MYRVTWCMGLRRLPVHALPLGLSPIVRSQRNSPELYPQRRNLRAVLKGVLIFGVCICEQEWEQ
eukprot:3215080-Pyramimonas_sp.AAC.1